jgi:protein prenyltransferase alpha subunit repeat containing protein 1
MSRALDKATREALKHGDHAEVYKQLSSALAQCLEHHFEIELVGTSYVLPLPSGRYYLQEGNALAIPKLRLVQAFIEARRIFFMYRSNSGSVSQEDASNATLVLLLMDPEHLTAANLRKHLIVSSGYDRALMRRETSFVDSYLTARLHRHSKSPTLWSHRNWLMRQRLNQYPTNAQAEIDIREGDYLPENDVLHYFRTILFVSAERHPRNYYAWCHARALLQLSKTPLPHSILEETRKWCFQHHDDISGWQFLMTIAVPRPLHLHVFNETVRVARALRWRNESVWFYLRTQAAAAFGEEQRRQVRLLHSALYTQADEEQCAVMDKALEWMLREGTLPVATEPDVV